MWTEYNCRSFTDVYVASLVNYQWCLDKYDNVD